MHIRQRLLSTTRTRPTAPRWVRLLVWALFTTVAVAGVAAVDSGISTQRDQLAAVPAAEVAVAGEVLADDAPATLDTNSPTYRNRYANSPKELLPAYRWGSALNFQTNLGVFDAGDDVMGKLGGVLFTVASFLWTFNLALLSFADQINVLNEAAGQINKVYVTVASNLWPILILAYLVILVRGAREMLKGNPMALWRLVVGFLIPVSVIYALANPASTSGAQMTTKDSTGRAAALNPKGTPAWYADRLTSQIDGLGTAIAGAFQADGGGSSLMIPSGQAHHCRDYVDVLEDTYEAFTSGQNTNGGASLFASRMWVLTTLEPWSIAQLGDQPHRHKASCHLLEWHAGTDSEERREIARLAFGRTFHPSLFTYTDRSDVHPKGWTNVHIRMSLWIACTPSSGGYVMNRSGTYALEKAEGHSESEAQEIGNRLCAQWADPDRGVGVVDDSGEDIPLDLEKTHHNRAKLGGRTDMRRYLNAITGHNPNIRLSMGLVAFVGGTVYLIAFAGASIGLLLAKIGLVLALMVLPFVLTMVGLQMEQGSKMLRWTASMCAVEIVFTMLLGVMFQLTQIGVTLVGGFDSGDTTASLGGGVEAGFARMLLISAVPIVVLVAMNALLKKMGLGKLTSPSGALGLVAGASSKAFKAGDGSAFFSPGGAMSSVAGTVRGARSAIGRVRDPFNTGIVEARRNARDVAKRAQRGKASEKELDSAFSKVQRAKDLRNDKLRGLANIAGLGIPGHLDRKAGKKAYREEEQRWIERNRRKLGLPVGEQANQAASEELEQWRKRASRYAPQTELTHDPAARARAQEELHNTLIHDTEGLGPGDPSRNAVASALIQQELARCGAAQMGVLEATDLSDPLSAVVPPQLREELRVEAAARIGIDPNHVVLDHFGNALIDPTTFSNWAEIPIHVRGRPELHLDPAMWEVGELETPADVATRVSGTLVATGHLYTEGNQVVVHEVRGSMPNESLAGQAMWAQLGEAAVNRAVLDAVGRIQTSDSGEGQLLASAAVGAGRIDSSEIAREIAETLGVFVNTQQESASRLQQAVSELSDASRSVASMDRDKVQSVVDAQIAALEATVEDRIHMRTAQALAAADPAAGTDAIIDMLAKIDDRERNRTEDIVNALREAARGGNAAQKLEEVAATLSNELEAAARAARDVEDATRRALDAHAAGGLRNSPPQTFIDPMAYAGSVWSPF